MKNTYVEKVIESWLTNCNELAFTPAFCQLLFAEGYELLRTGGGSLEYGKDVIAIKENIVFCYQLKGGNLTTKAHFDLINTQLDELVHIEPTENKIRRLPRKSFLVTNGLVGQTVKDLIQQFNDSKWKDCPVELIDGEQLKARFVEQLVLPKNLESYKNFLNLYFSDGSDLCNIESISSFVNELIPISSDSISMVDMRKQIHSAVIFVTYILETFYRADNHSEVVKVLTILTLHILALIEKNRLSLQHYKSLLDILLEQILLSVSKMKDDFSTIQNLVADQSTQYTVYKNLILQNQYLKLMLAGRVYELLYSKNSFNDGSELDNFLIGRTVTPFTEGDLMVHCFRYLYITILETKVCSNIYSSDGILEEAVKWIFDRNYRNNKKTLPLIPPYYDGIDFFKWKFGFEMNNSISLSRIRMDGHSYYLKTLIEILVASDRLEYIEKEWTDLSDIASVQYVTEEDWRYLLWNNYGDEKGHMLVEEWSDQETSIKSIKESAKNSIFPEILKSYPKIIPFYIAVFNHRISFNLLKSMIETI